MRVLAWATLALAGCNSLIGFEVEGGEEGEGETKTLIVTLTGEARGSVSSMPSGINCSPTIDNCSEDFPRDAMVTLTATPGAGARLGAWSGGGCSGTGTCTVTLGIDTSIEARFDDARDGHNFMFVTSNAYAPSTFSPLTRADGYCQAEATAAGLPGTYVAFLSTSTMSARTRLGTARGWLRADGKPFADTFDDFVAAKVYYAPWITAAGTRTTDLFRVAATGTMQDGMASPETCGDWTSTTGQLWIGGPRTTATTWMSWFTSPCNETYSLYCFGIDRSQALTFVPLTGRLAFLSATTWTPSSGVASADAICQNEAIGAGQPGTFLALLATGGASAASRFNVGGVPWVRADGVALAAPGRSPFDELEAGLHVRADGSYAQGAVVPIGGNLPTTPATQNCSNWTDASAAGRTTIAYANHTWMGDATNPDVLPCNTPFALYCFEQ